MAMQVKSCEKYLTVVHFITLYKDVISMSLHLEIKSGRLSEILKGINLNQRFERVQPHDTSYKVVVFTHLRTVCFKYRIKREHLGCSHAHFSVSL